MKTFKQLSISANVSENRNTTPATLCKKVELFMTDAVRKKIGIENTIPNALGSNHHPYHLLCKSRTVETLVRSNLNVLAEVEKSVKQEEIFEYINPSIESFFHGKKCSSGS